MRQLVQATLDDKKKMCDSCKYIEKWASQYIDCPICGMELKAFEVVKG